MVRELTKEEKQILENQGWDSSTLTKKDIKEWRKSEKYNNRIDRYDRSVYHWMESFKAMYEAFEKYNNLLDKITLGNKDDR